MGASILLVLVLLCLVAGSESFVVGRSTFISTRSSSTATKVFALNAGRSNRPSSSDKYKSNRNSESKERRVAPKSTDSRQSSIMRDKVSRMLRDELVDIIANCDIKATVYPDEALLRGVSIADIEFSADLSLAKIYLSILGNSVQKRQVYVWLCSNVGQVRYSLSQRLRELKRLPEISFSLVDTQSAFYFNDIMDDIALPQRSATVVDTSTIEFEDE